MIWKMVNLEEFKEIYKVGIDYENNSVVICSIDRTTICKDGKVRHSKSYTMKQYEDKDGYLRVSLRSGDICKQIPVHVIVAKTFLENPNNYTTVHHIDHNKINNMPSNLEYIDEHRHYELHRGEANKASCKSTSKEVLQYAGDTLIASYVSTKEASRMTGISQPGISMAASGKRKSAGGYRWEYK